MRLQLSCLLALAASSSTLAQHLTSSGFTNCLSDAPIQVQKANIDFDKSTGIVTFDVAGSSAREQKVKASLVVTAYGQQVYTKDFDPCSDPRVEQLCPVPAGEFAAKGNQTIPQQYLDQVPSIAFSIPDLDGEATLRLKAADSNQDVACVESGVSNGKTLEVPAIQYVAVGVAAAALLLSGLSALGNAGNVGSGPAQPSFTAVMHWFQGIAVNGMLSVQYPSVYRSFTKNFAFSTGLIPWTDMQRSIDGFRSKTGGNLTVDSVEYLQQAKLGFTDGQSNQTDFLRRSIELFRRDGLDASVNGTASAGSTSSGNGTQTNHIVSGIQAYAEQLLIPQANTFMTVLLVFAILIAAIATGILLFKVILEAWALFGTFPKKLTGFRKRYWRLLANTIVNLILLLYGIWTLYCIYQFTNGDSWAAKLLAGVTLGIFTAVLLFFCIRIWIVVHKHDRDALYDDKKVWHQYSIFYDVYKKGRWWLFMPAIVYMFAKGCIIAGANGHGLIQSGGQLIVEAVMLVLLLWSRPYETRGGNWINIVIQVVRVLSVVCVLVFVEELGIAQSTKTITGVVLIAVQAALTGVLAILIAVNAIINCCRENPHARRRREAQKLNRDFDNLTPLDARNSMLILNDPRTKEATGYPMTSYTKKDYLPLHGHADSTDRLVDSEADLGYARSRSTSRTGLTARYDPPPMPHRQPTLPVLQDDFRGRAF